MRFVGKVDVVAQLDAPLKCRCRIKKRNAGGFTESRIIAFCARRFRVMAPMSFGRPLSSR